MLYVYRQIGGTWGWAPVTGPGWKDAKLSVKSGLSWREVGYLDQWGKIGGVWRRGSIPVVEVTIDPAQLTFYWNFNVWAHLGAPTKPMLVRIRIGKRAVMTAVSHRTDPAACLDLTGNWSLDTKFEVYLAGVLLGASGLASIPYDGRNMTDLDPLLNATNLTATSDFGPNTTSAPVWDETRPAGPGQGYTAMMAPQGGFYAQTLTRTPDGRGGDCIRTHRATRLIILEDDDSIGAVLPGGGGGAPIPSFWRAFLGKRKVRYRTYAGEYLFQEADSVSQLLRAWYVAGWSGSCGAGGYMAASVLGITAPDGVSGSKVLRLSPNPVLASQHGDVPAWQDQAIDFVHLGVTVTTLPRLKYAGNYISGHTQGPTLSLPLPPINASNLNAQTVLDGVSYRYWRYFGTLADVAYLPGYSYPAIQWTYNHSTLPERSAASGAQPFSGVQFRLGANAPAVTLPNDRISTTAPEVSGETPSASSPADTARLARLAPYFKTCSAAKIGYYERADLRGGRTVSAPASRQLKACQLSAGRGGTPGWWGGGISHSYAQAVQAWGSSLMYGYSVFLPDSWFGTVASGQALGPPAGAAGRAVVGSEFVTVEGRIINSGQPLSNVCGAFVPFE